MMLMYCVSGNARATVQLGSVKNKSAEIIEKKLYLCKIKKLEQYG